MFIKKRELKLENKGQTFGIAIITAIFVFIIGMICLNFLMPEITNARTNLNCSSADTISDGTKLLCLTIDLGVPYWILIVLSITIGGITAKLSL